MGSDSSKIGGLKIELEKFIGMAGELIKGQIHVSLKETVEPCELFLLFKGVERTHWTEQHGKHRVTYSGKSVITKVQYLIQSWSERIFPCDITVPFEFLTPKMIPGTFQFLGSSEKRALVEYYFKAILKNPKLKLMDKQNIYLGSVQSYEKVVCEPKVAKLISWCCCKKGEISINLRWINEFYVNGSPIECDLFVDNTRSLVDIKAITAELYFGINVISGSGHHGYFREKLMKSTYNIVVPKGYVLNESNGAKFRFDLSQAPKAVQYLNVHTSASQMMNTNFYVDFYLETGLHCLCCGDNPLYTSSFIVRPLMNIPSASSFEIPPGWQPTIYRAVSLSYNPRDENNDKGDTQKLIEFRNSIKDKSN